LRFQIRNRMRTIKADDKVTRRIWQMLSW
jgi:hypothetical protein